MLFLICCQNKISCLLDKFCVQVCGKDFRGQKQPSNPLKNLQKSKRKRLVKLSEARNDCQVLGR